jgi:hypothetical protein
MIMMGCVAVRRGTLVLLPVLAVILAASGARADTAAATACAANLTGDARVIFDATLPEVEPGVDLRAVVTARTRSLAMAGEIDRDTARQSAGAAAKCLQRAAS